MFRIEWLCDGTVLATDVCTAAELAVAQGKAFGRAVYLARKRSVIPTEYRILDADGRQLLAGAIPAEPRSGKWMQG